MNGLRRFTLAALCCVSFPAHAQEGRGFAELRLALFPGAEGEEWQVVERLRPSLKTELTERVSLVATVEAALTQGRRREAELERALREGGLGPLLDRTGAFPGFENAALRVDGSDDYLEVDRLYVDYYGERFDVRLGRQAINWGSAQFFNPTDPFPEVLLAEPWRPRRGVNALRVNLPFSAPFGDLNDLSLVIAGNDALTELRAAGRLRVNFAGTDLALVGAWRGADRDVLVGLDLRGTLEIGWWVEAAYLLGDDPHEEVSVGIDYSFPILERATVFLQYYRNGAGSPDPELTSALLERSGGLGLGATRGERQGDPFAPFTVGRDYGLLGASLVFDEEVSSTLALVQNLNDGSGFAVPTVTYAALGWLEVAVSAQLPYALSGGGEFKPSAEALRFTLPLELPSGAATIDLNGLVPEATFTFWTRANF